MLLVNMLMLAGELVHLLLMWCFCFLSMIAMYYAELMLSPDVSLLAGTDNLLVLSCLKLDPGEASDKSLIPASCRRPTYSRHCWLSKGLKLLAMICGAGRCIAA